MSNEYGNSLSQRNLSLITLHLFSREHNERCHRISVPMLGRTFFICLKDFLDKSICLFSVEKRFIEEKEKKTKCNMRFPVKMNIIFVRSLSFFSSSEKKNI